MIGIVVRSLEWAPQNGQVVKGVEIKSNIIDGVQNVSREKVSPSIETTTNSGQVMIMYIHTLLRSSNKGLVQLYLGV